MTQPRRSRLVRDALVPLLASIALTACASGNPAVSARRSVRDAIRSEQLIRPERLPERALAVLPLVAAPDDSLGRVLGWAMTELMSQDLARSRRLIIVERARIGALLQELSLAKSGRVDSLTAPRAGKLLGARWVTVGSLSRDPGVTDRYRVTLRTVNVASGVVTPAFDGVLRLDNVSADQEAMTRQLLSSLGLSAVAATRAAASAPPSLDLMLRLGAGVQLAALGNGEAGTAALAALSKEAPGFAPAAVASRESRRANMAINPDVRRGDVRDISQAIMPLVAVRTAEAVDVAASSLVQLVLLNIVIVVP